MQRSQLEELLLQSLEHEMGGVKVYEMAVDCAVDPGLTKEWQKYLSQTKTHVTRLQEVCKAFGIDAKRETPGRAVVRHTGGGLVEAMKMAKRSNDDAAAQLVACECVVLAETKDHLDWQLLSQCADKLTGAEAKALKDACDVVEDEEDEHLYHTQGWCRELWLKSLGLKSVLPPPEERKDVRTAIGAARAEQAAHPKH